jgi:cytochrome c-type biogenesis protein CcmH/NrfG
MMGWMCAALVVGFFGGAVFGVYKSTPTTPRGHGGGMAPAAPQQPDAADKKNRIPELEKRTADHPEDVEAWVQLGHLYFDTQQTKKAIGAYEKALALNPKDANVWTDLGVMYRRDGRTEKALEAFDTAIKIDPKHEIAWFNRGVVLLHDMNDRQGALKAWESLVKVNPFAMAPNGQSIDQMVQALKQSAGQMPPKQ